MYYTNLAGAPPGRKQTRQETAKINRIKEYGEVAEWFKALVLKTGVGQPTEGSNPSLSVLLYNTFPRRKAGFLLSFPSVLFYQSKSFFFKLYYFFSKITLLKTLPLTPQNAPQKRGLTCSVICCNSVPHQTSYACQTPLFCLCSNFARAAYNQQHARTLRKECRALPLLAV